MAIVKQSSGQKRQWFDLLVQIVCVTAVLTLATAAAAGILGRRLNVLRQAQQAVEKAEKHRLDKNLSAALEAAKSQWNQKQVGLEKALLSAKLKIKAQQSANAKIRNQLTAMRKELAALKATGNVMSLGTVASDGQVPETAAAKSPSPPAASPTAAAPLADTAKPTQLTPASKKPVPADVVALEDASQTPSTDTGKAPNRSSNAQVTPLAPPQSSLLEVPDADQAVPE
jgi:hypothetical protein